MACPRPPLRHTVAYTEPALDTRCQTWCNSQFVGYSSRSHTSPYMKCEPGSPAPLADCKAAPRNYRFCTRNNWPGRLCSKCPLGCKMAYTWECRCSKCHCSKNVYHIPQANNSLCSCTLLELHYWRCHRASGSQCGYSGVWCIHWREFPWSCTIHRCLPSIQMR